MLRMLQHPGKNQEYAAPPKIVDEPKKKRLKFVAKRQVRTFEDFFFLPLSAHEQHRSSPPRGEDLFPLSPLVFFFLVSS